MTTLRSLRRSTTRVWFFAVSLVLTLAPVSFAQQPTPQPNARILIPEELRQPQPNQAAAPRAQKPELILQTGVTEPAGAIAFSPDGHLLASIGALGSTVKLWEVTTGRELAAFSAKTPGGSRQMGAALMFSPDGQTLLAYSGGVLSQWDVRTEQQLRQLKLTEDGSAETNAVFSPDAKLVALNAVEKRTLTVYDTTIGRQLQSFAYGTREVPAIAFSPDGRTLTMFVISDDYEPLKKSAQLVAHDVVSWQVAKTIKVTEKDFKEEFEKAIREKNKHWWKSVLSGRPGAMSTDVTFRSARPYRALRFSPDGRTLAMLSRDLISGYDGKTTENSSEVNVRFFDFAGGRELNNISIAAEARNQYREMPFLSADTTFALSPDGRQFVAVGNDATVKLVDAAGGRALATMSGHNGEVMAVAYSGDGKLVASSGVDSAIRIWDVANAAATGRAEVVRTLGVFTAPVNAVAFSEDGRTLSVAGLQAVSVWDLSNGTALRTISLPGTTPRDRSDLTRISFFTEASPAYFTADGRLFVAKEERAVKVWETRSGRELRSFSLGDGRKLDGLAVNRDGSAVAILEDNKLDMRLMIGPGVTSPSDLTKDDEFRARITAMNKFSRSGPSKKLVKEITKLWIAAQEAKSRGEMGKAIELSKQAEQLQEQLTVMMGAAIGTENLTPQANVSVMNVRTGQPISAAKIQSMPTAIGYAPAFTPFGSAAAFTLDGRLLAFTFSNNQIKLSDVASGREIARLYPDRHGVTLGLAISPDGRTLAAGYVEYDPVNFKLRLWDVAQPQPRELRTLPLSSLSTTFAFSPDGRVIASGGLDVKLWDVASGRELFALPGHPLPVNAISFSPDGKLLVTGCEDGGARLWDAQTGQLLATMVSLNKGADWLAVTPDGLFDGTPAAWNQILWRFSANLTDLTPVEVYFDEFFYPSLLADIYSGKRPRAAQDFAQKDRRQPLVKLSLPDAQTASATIVNRTIKVRLDISEPAAGWFTAAGARDVRLFRNGTLVKVWRGDVLKGQRQVALETTLPIVAGENHLVAYAFNRDNVKSSDAALIVTGSDSLRRKGTAYVLACGVNRYANEQYNLKYAVADATSLAAEVRAQQLKLGHYERVEIIPLLDAEATKANILLALRRFAGNNAAAPPTAPAALAKIQPAQPEDAVMIHFAGHGVAQGERFYLVPHDLGYTGSRTALTAAAVQTILSRSISDLELEAALEGLNAEHLMLVIDACNSGQALEAEEKRRGPMNSKGLAQLAYEKGMYILTAAQSYQVALEAEKLGHGYLTYALVEEGLKKGAADRDAKDGQVLVREWFNFATERVPQMQEQEDKTRILLEEEKAADPKKRGAQQPRVFYRRELEARPLIVAKP